MKHKYGFLIRLKDDNINRVLRQVVICGGCIFGVTFVLFDPLRDAASRSVIQQFICNIHNSERLQCCVSFPFNLCRQN